MKETKDVLLKKTREELDNIAVKLGINTAGLAKTRIAESIVEARNKAATKEIPKSKIETPKVALPAKIKAAPKVELSKYKPRTSIGTKGVYAKCAAIDAQINENNEAVAVIGVGIDEINNSIKGLRSDIDKNAIKMQKEGSLMLKQGAAKMNKGIKEKLNGIDAQIKTNKKAAANMNAGIKELNNGIREMETAIDRKNDEIKKGVKVIHVGIKGLENKFEDFRTETSNYKHDFYFG